MTVKRSCPTRPVVWNPIILTWPDGRIKYPEFSTNNRLNMEPIVLYATKWRLLFLSNNATRCQPLECCDNLLRHPSVTEMRSWRVVWHFAVWQLNLHDHARVRPYSVYVIVLLPTHGTSSCILRLRLNQWILFRAFSDRTSKFEALFSTCPRRDLLRHIFVERSITDVSHIESDYHWMHTRRW